MNDDTEIWLVERYVDLGNQTFWHELGRLFRHNYQTDEHLFSAGHIIGKRDAAKYGARYRIRKVAETTLFDSEGDSDVSK